MTPLPFSRFRQVLGTPFRAGGILVAALVLVAGPLAGQAVAQACSPQVAGAIGGIVFLDANANGTRQAGEDGINGVVLRVTGPSGSTQLVTSGGVSTIPGQYGTGPTLCASGNYLVEIVSVPDGYVVTGPSSAVVAISAAPGTGVLSKIGNLDFALGLAPCVSTIGDRVWNDLNADGIQDAGEPGIPGVVVHLYEGSTVVQSTMTDANGNYSFTVPCSRTFTVVVETPAGFAPSPSLQGGDVTRDSDGSPTLVTIGNNEHRTDVDFGFYALCQGIIGDFVWHDLNRNGVQDAGEPGLYNVKVELVQDGTVVRTTFTDAGGHYVFSGLCPGTYEVRYDPATIPAGFEPTAIGQGTTGTDSNASPTTVTLAGFNASDLTIDFGFQVPCAGVIGDFVWDDLNQNGIQDSGEPGITGVEVRLYRAGASAPIQVTLTDGSGYYRFTGLCGGDYIVEVNPNTLPPGVTWMESPANQGGDDEVDSDGVGNRAAVSLPADDASDLTIDFGYYRPQPLTVTKTAAGSFERRITWTLTKTVSPASHSGQAGQTAGTSTWAVTATKSETVTNYRVTGQITISNPNGFAVDFTAVDQLNDGTTAAVTCPAGSVPAGGTVVCSYVATPGNAAATLNTATVSTSLGDFTGSAPVAFAATVIGDETVTLADARFSYSQVIAATAAPTFPETFSCPADASLYTNGVYTRTETNTATLTGANTNLSASAQVTVTCRKQQFAGESATGFGTRYPGTSNWFRYTPYATTKVDLVAGRNLMDAGDIFMSRSGSGASARTTITIVLHDGWSWDNVRDVLKIQPFDRAPTSYVQPGAFIYKFSAPNITNTPGTTVVFSGNTATVTMPGTSARFYGIHADVLRAIP